MSANKIFQADTTQTWPLPDESIDAIITSPPYWHHRDNGPTTTTLFDYDPQCQHVWKKVKSSKEGCFCEKCGGWKGQLGQEPDAADYVRHLVQIFDKEARRVLKSTGQLWINLGDCFGKKGRRGWIQTGQKLYLPARLAIGMQDKGWVLRNDVIWAKSVTFSTRDSKGGSMPSSVHTRFNNTHEYFLFFVKPLGDRRNYYVNEKTSVVAWDRIGKGKWETKNYFSCLDNLRIEHKWVNENGERIDLYGRPMGSRPHAGGSPKQHAAGQPHLYMYNHPLGKNPGSVWQFNTDPFQGEHNSPFPPRLIQWIIRFSVPEKTCPKCGLPEEKFYDRTEKKVRFARCQCNSILQPGIVLDPFMGAGTTAIAAMRENRYFSGIELNPHYVQAAEKRLLTEFPEMLELKLEKFLINEK